MMFVIGLVDSRDFYFFWVGVFGICFTEMALSLHDHTVTAYRKGPSREGQFTLILTGTTSKGSR